MLTVEGIHTYIGISHILHGVSLEVNKGEIVCLLGRNGVGKSTTLKSIMALTPPKEGSIRFEGDNLTGRHTYEVAKRGISYIPEDRRIFPMLTVKENLVLGTKINPDLTPERKVDNLKKVWNYFPVLNNKRNLLGGILSGGEQQMLTIARGMMGSPKLMLIDEPCEGLAPIIVQELAKIITKMCKDEEMTMLLVEQNANVALKLADRGYVLEKGEVVFEGTGEEMRCSEEVKSCCGV